MKYVRISYGTCHRLVSNMLSQTGKTQFCVAKFRHAMYIKVIESTATRYKLRLEGSRDERVYVISNLHINKADQLSEESQSVIFGFDRILHSASE
jgi:hypothetical protein